MVDGNGTGRAGGLVGRPAALARRIRPAAAALALLAATGPGAAKTVRVDNTLANHYAGNPFPAACGRAPVIEAMPPGHRIERPHTIYNRSTKTWVLWAHYEASGYGTAEALVATSASQCGPFAIVRTFRPLGREVRDDVLFQDDDGTAYFVAASNKDGGVNDTMAIFRLTPDYTDVDASAGTHWVFDKQFREAPIVVKKDGVYFLLASQAAGWFPSQAAYITATAMLGDWSKAATLADAATFGGQNANLMIYGGRAGTAYILVLDHLGGTIGKDDGAIWLPLILDSRRRTATLDWYSHYSVDLDSGAVSLPSRVDLAKGAPATATSSAPDAPASKANDGNYGTEWIAASGKFPASWTVDLGADRHIGEVEISWWMKKGSEAYYAYSIDYGTDGTHFATIDRSNNKFYGFTVDKTDITARYIRINLLGATLANNPHNWYTPRLWEVRLFP